MEEFGQYGEMVETMEHPVIYVRVSGEERDDILVTPSEGSVFSYVSIGAMMSAEFQGKLEAKKW